MTNTQQRQKSVRQALNDLFPRPPQGNHSRRLDSLAALVSGIVGTRSCHLPQVAQHIDGKAKAPSREKKLSRWLDNKWVDVETFFLPCLQRLLDRAIAKGKPLFFIADSTTTGHCCTTWMISLVWGKRALPLVWFVLAQPKGHAPQELPCELVRSLSALLPTETNTDIVFLGDGEFDTLALQDTLQDLGWKYVLRTAKDLTITLDDESFRFDSVAPADGETIFWMESVALTRKQHANGFNALVWHDPAYKDPIYLLTTIDNGYHAAEAYRRRFLIETLFGDTKSRGFHLHKTHLRDPKKIHRLLIAVALAYIWIIWLGIQAQTLPFYRQMLHRTDRSDWSTFRFGFALLNEFARISQEPPPVSFVLDS